MPTSLVSNIDSGRSDIMARNVMLQRVRDLDWSSTPAGSIDQWSHELRSVCRTALLSSTPMAVLIGPEGVVFANNAIRLLFGAEYEHGLGKPLRDVLMHSAEFMSEMLSRTLGGRSSRLQDLAVPFSVPGGTRHAWVDLDFTPVVEAKGTIVAALVICIETTQRKQALIDLEISRERLDLALSSGGVVGVWEIDFERELVRSDARYALLHNVDPDTAAVGAHPEIFIAGIHPDDKVRVMEMFDAAKIDGEYRCQHRVVGRDGTRWIVASGRVRHDASGAPLTFNGTAVDVTAQVETAAALAKSEKRFRAYAETLPHVIFGWNAEGQVNYANQRWYEFTGLEEGDSKAWDWPSFLNAEDAPTVLIEWKCAISARSGLSLEARHLHNSGSYRWMRVVASPIFDADERFSGWIGTLTDIHEEKMLEIERDLVSKELDHRIKNFFAVMQGLVSLTVREDHDVNSFANRLQGRISALHHSHGLIYRGLDRNVPQKKSLHALFRRLLSPFLRDDAPEHILIEGDDIDLDERDTTSFALVFHELATNAAKYGALSAAEGKLSILSTLNDGRLTILWQESGVSSPKKETNGTGFGSQLINLLIERQMNGNFNRFPQENGMRVEISIPL